MRVAIIGLGIVGSAQVRLFSGHHLVTYDITQDSEYPGRQITGCDFAVVCVGTPDAAGRADTSAVYEAFLRLPPGLPVLIRSTVPPGTTDELQEARPDSHVCHAPEFLTEREGSVWPDSADVPWMLLGGSHRATGWFRERLSPVFPGTIHECTALESELAKYTANIYWAARVTFVNEMAAVCTAFGVSWEKVRVAWLRDDRVHEHYTHLEGFPPGFGGRCWPKDLAAIITASSDAGHKPEFLRAIEEANERFLADE